MLRIVLYTAAVAAASVLATPALAGGEKWNDMTTAERTEAVRKAVRHDQSVVRWWKSHRPKPPSPVTARLTTGNVKVHPWPTCDPLDARVPPKVCASVTRLPGRVALLARLVGTIPETGDWLTAVRLIQRAYPDTAWWLTSCSASEGGHGPWVTNHGGSGASGWMQFLSGTFWRMYGAAKDDLTARGFTLPASSASWYSPIGQAAAAAWGYTHGRRGEWMGSGC